MSKDQGILCKDCMYFEEKKPAMFPSGYCHQPYWGRKTLVRARDYCSRATKGTFQDYLEMSRIADAILLADIMRNGK